MEVGCRHEGTCQVEWFKFGRSEFGPWPNVGCWDECSETGAGGGIHRLPEPLGSGKAPFAWLTGVTSPRLACRGGVSWCHGPARGCLPKSDRGRPVSWLTDPSRHFRAASSHEPSGRPVSVLLVPFQRFIGFVPRVGGKVFHGRVGRSMQ